MEVSYPYLHFDMMVNQEVNRFLEAFHPVFRIGINLFEFIDQSRMEEEQADRLEFLSSNLADILQRKPTELRVDIFNIIGVLDESYDECNNGMDLIKGSDKLVSILREYKKRNPSS